MKTLLALFLCGCSAATAAPCAPKPQYTLHATGAWTYADVVESTRAIWKWEEVGYVLYSDANPGALPPSSAHMITVPHEAVMPNVARGTCEWIGAVIDPNQIAVVCNGL